MESFIEDSLAIASCKEHHVEACVHLEDLMRLEEPISSILEKHIPSHPNGEVHEGPLIEDIIENPSCVAMIENIEDMELSQDYFSKNDHMCIPDFP